MSGKSREDIFLREAAWKYLLEQKIDKLPVDPWELAEKNGYKILTYDQLAVEVDKTPEYFMQMFSNDGFVFWSKKELRYIICYNALIPAATVRWTLMHEIGHIVLKHVAPLAPPLTRRRKNENPIFEREADGFARRVICPSIVLHKCSAVEPPDIMKLCGISGKAAEYRSRYMKTLEARGKWRTDSLETEVEKQFESFIREYVYDVNFYKIAPELKYLKWGIKWRNRIKPTTGDGASMWSFPVNPTDRGTVSLCTAKRGRNA